MVETMESRELEVRTIDGQSLMLRATDQETVQHLKLQLQRLKWPMPSEVSLQFHVYFKGAKLDPCTQLGALTRHPGDFLVLIPYTRHNKSKRRKLVDSNSQVEDNGGTECVNLGSAISIEAKNEVMKPTEAMWHSIVADFTTVKAMLTTELKSFSDEKNLCHKGGPDSSEGKQFEGLRQFPNNWNAVSPNGTKSGEFNTLGPSPNNCKAVSTKGMKSGEFKETRSSVNTFLESNLGVEDTSKTKGDVPDYIDFLASPISNVKNHFQKLPAKAIKTKRNAKVRSILLKSKASALPPVLKKLSQVFHALNTVCGFLQKQHMQATWQNVKQALQQIGCPDGEKITVQDIHFLSALCPRLVVLSNMTGEGDDSSFYIDLFDPATLKKQREAGTSNVATATNIQQIGPSDWMPSSVGKQVSDRVIENAVGRRMKAFQKAVTELVDYLKNNGNGSRDVSIDEFMAAAKILTKQEDKHLALKTALPRPPRGHKNLARCVSIENLGVLEMMEHLKTGLGSLGQFVHCEHIMHRKAAYGELQKPLTSWTNSALKEMGISRLYAHQAQAINAVMSGQSAIVATSTASGKSLCYNVPILDEMCRNEDSCALYLFPTKALAQDQLRALQLMSGNTEFKMKMGVYDGDTPQNCRLKLRDSARLIISNPDMLHTSVMPLHRQFARILSNLRFVVLDEAHAYRGVFGCHTALILRRLRRLCRFVYGTEPTFIVCSATVANPSGHAQVINYMI